jgi:hypothetical protein
MGSVAFETRKAKQGAAYDPQSGLMIKSHCFYLPYHRASDERRFLVRLTKDDCAGGRVMETEDSPSPEILFPHWQNEYQAALVELDREKLPQRVAAAEAAIFNRLQAISQSFDHQAERQAIEDALTALRVLKRDELGFPDWGKK